jgi:hypothetical protein
MKAFLYAPGTRVTVVRGPFPVNPSLLGRSGVVVETDEYRPQRYGVQLDDESRVRDFHEDELEPLPDPPKPGSAVGSAGPGLR